MAFLIDTNILLRLVQPRHPQSTIARRALDVLRSRAEPLCICHQNIVEFWVVTTRPISANGLGFSTERTHWEVGSILDFFLLLPESPLRSEWERLVVDYKVSGKNAHDARLVAAMLIHEVESILTFNVQDFVRYREIRAFDPKGL
jgi:predicted nucleic acid-binding protein